MTTTITTCKYFGVRTSRREDILKCRNCRAAHLELFKKCTIESNITMGTSIEVDEKGNTVSISPGKVSDTVLMFEKFGEVHSSVKKEDSNSESNTEPKPKKQTARRVKGLSKLCRDLRSDGVSDSGIQMEVAKMYVGVGISAEEAEAKAKSCVKNMKWVV